MAVWLQVLTFLGGGTAILACVAWLIRSLVTHSLDKHLAAYQAKVDAQHELELERTRSALQKDFLEHEVRFRTLHAKVAETIAETFSHLVTLEKAVGSYVSVLENRPRPSKEDRLDAVNKSDRVFSAYFFSREIYLPPDLGDKIRDVYDKLLDATEGMTLALREEEMPDTPNLGLWAEAFRDFQVNVRPLCDELKREFHARLVGSPSDKPEHGAE